MNPARPDPGRIGKLCLGTRSSDLSHALFLTPLPRELKEQYPHLRISTLWSGYNRAVFQHNPHIRGVSLVPDAIYGDEANWNHGHLIQQKEQFFGLEPATQPKPEIYLSAPEREWAKHLIESKRLEQNNGPLCLLNPWDESSPPKEAWDALVARWNKRVRFWQIGTYGQSTVQGCEYYLFFPRRPRFVRRLFAVAERSQLYIGLPTGAMHVARAFDVPSLITLPNPVSDPEKESQFYTGSKQMVLSQDPKLEAVDRFLEAYLESHAS